MHASKGTHLFAIRLLDFVCVDVTLSVARKTIYSGPHLLTRSATRPASRKVRSQPALATKVSELERHRTSVPVLCNGDRSGSGDR